jgi:hypothetical protein
MPTDATDADIQYFRRWPTPTSARKRLAKHVEVRQLMGWPDWRASYGRDGSSGVFMTPELPAIASAMIGVIGILVVVDLPFLGSNGLRVGTVGLLLTGKAAFELWRAKKAT